MSKQKELLKNTIIIFLGKFSTQFLSFFLLPIYTNFLSTDDYGFVDLLLTYVSLLVPIITIQQEMATFRFLIDSRGNDDNIRRVISTSLKNVITHTIIFIAFYLLLIHFFDLKYKYYIIFNIIICVYSNLFLQISRGLGKNTNYSIASFITGVTTLCSNIVLICFFKVGAKGMLISMSLANLLCFIFLFISLKMYNYIRFKYVDNDLKKEMLKYSLPLVPNGISWWFINVSDRTIVSTFLGVSANGIYAIANKFPSIISSFLGIFSLSWSESASVHINEEDRDQFFSNVAETILKLFSCACILLISILPFIFNIIIGKNYIDAYNYIPIFSIGTMSSCIVNVYSAVYIAKKQTKKVASTSIASAIINIIINILFIKIIGLYAAAISTALAFFIMMIYRHFDVKKYVNISYNKYLVLSTILMFIISISLYYINNYIFNILSLIIMAIYTIIINRKIIKNIFAKFFHKKNYK